MSGEADTGSAPRTAAAAVAWGTGDLEAEHASLFPAGCSPADFPSGEAGRAPTTPQEVERQRLAERQRQAQREAPSPPCASTPLAADYISYCAAWDSRVNKTLLRTLSAPQPSEIVVLDFTANFIGHKGVLALCPLLPALPNLVELRLCKNGLRNECLGPLLHNAAHVLSIDLSGNEYLTDARSLLAFARRRRTATRHLLLEGTNLNPRQLGQIELVLRDRRGELPPGTCKLPLIDDAPTSPAPSDRSPTRPMAPAAEGPCTPEARGAPPPAHGLTSSGPSYEVSIEAGSSQMSFLGRLRSRQLGSSVAADGGELPSWAWEGPEGKVFRGAGWLEHWLGPLRRIHQDRSAELARSLQSGPLSPDEVAHQLVYEGLRALFGAQGAVPSDPTEQEVERCVERAEERAALAEWEGFAAAVCTPLGEDLCVEPGTLAALGKAAEAAGCGAAGRHARRADITRMCEAAADTLGQKPPSTGRINHALGRLYKTHGGVPVLPDGGVPFELLAICVLDCFDGEDVYKAPPSVEEHSLQHTVPAHSGRDVPAAPAGPAPGSREPSQGPRRRTPPTSPPPKQLPVGPGLVSPAAGRSGFSGLAQRMVSDGGSTVRGSEESDQHERGASMPLLPVVSQSAALPEPEQMAALRAAFRRCGEGDAVPCGALGASAAEFWRSAEGAALLHHAYDSSLDAALWQRLHGADDGQVLWEEWVVLCCVPRVPVAREAVMRVRALHRSLAPGGVHAGDLAGAAAAVSGELAAALGGAAPPEGLAEGLACSALRGELTLEGLLLAVWSCARGAAARDHYTRGKAPNAVLSFLGRPAHPGMSPEAEEDGMEPPDWGPAARLQGEMALIRELHQARAPDGRSAHAHEDAVLLVYAGLSRLMAARGEGSPTEEEIERCVSRADDELLLANWQALAIACTAPLHQDVWVDDHVLHALCAAAAQLHCPPERLLSMDQVTALTVAAARRLQCAAPLPAQVQEGIQRAYPTLDGVAKIPAEGVPYEVALLCLCDVFDDDSSWHAVGVECGGRG